MPACRSRCVGEKRLPLLLYACRCDAALRKLPRVSGQVQLFRWSGLTVAGGHASTG
jgi:hypothetical protein